MKPCLVCQKHNILLLPVATSKRTFSRLNVATRVKRRQNDAFCDIFCHHILRQGDIVHIVGDIKFHSEKIHQKLGNMESRKMVILLAGKPYRIMSCKAVIYCSQRDDLPIYIPCVLYLSTVIDNTYMYSNIESAWYQTKFFLLFLEKLLHWFGLVVRPLPVLVSNKEVPSYCVECCAAAAPISLLCAIRRSLEVLYNIQKYEFGICFSQYMLGVQPPPQLNRSKDGNILPCRQQQSTIQ